MRRNLKSAVILLALALVGAGWFMFAPPQLGGKTGYVIVSGSSMNPLLHEGDLVLLRDTGDAVHVGDVVAYRSAHLGGRTVLHRVIALEGDSFALQGDNNDFIDPDRPTIADMQGGLWLTVPRLGGALAALQEPRWAALVAALVAFFIFGGDRVVRRRRRNPVEDGSPAASSKAIVVRAASEQAERVAPGTLRPAVWVAGTFALAFGAFMLVSLTRPLEHEQRIVDYYTHQGSFSYHATANAISGVYPQGTIETGDPVFVRLVDNVEARFDYELVSERARDVTVMGSLSAVIRDPASGWEKTVSLQPERGLSEKTGLETVIEMDQLVAETIAFQEATGSRTQNYQVVLAPIFKVTGTVGGKAVEDVFAPRYRFWLDEVKMAPLPEVVVGEEPNLVAPVEDGEASELVQSTLSLPGIEMSVHEARRAGSLGFSASVLVLCGLGGLLLRGRRGSSSESARIDARYRGEIVRARSYAPVARSVVEVASIDDLVRLARRFEQVILSVETDGAVDYFLEEGGVRYGYRARIARAELPATSGGNGLAQRSNSTPSPAPQPEKLAPETFAPRRPPSAGPSVAVGSITEELRTRDADRQAAHVRAGEQDRSGKLDPRLERHLVTGGAARAEARTGSSMAPPSPQRAAAPARAVTATGHGERRRPPVPRRPSLFERLIGSRH